MMSQQTPSAVRLQDAFLRLQDKPHGLVVKEPATTGPSANAHDTEETCAEAATSFRPALEVDQFAPPPLVSQLLESISPILAGCLRQIRQRLPKSERVVGLISPERGHGCTTTAILLASRLSRERATALVIDASPDRALADSLSLEIESGWEQAMLRRRPLREVIIRSNSDGFDILPGQPGSLASKVTGVQPTDWPELLKAYDWILIDFGSSFARTAYSPTGTNLSENDGEESDSVVRSGMGTSVPFVSLCSSFVMVQRCDSGTARFSLPAGAAEILGVIETFVQPTAESQVLVNPKEAA
ncbi:MAG: cellulose synthase operon protein YhjQ/BcsQ [Thermogutta sp.]|nr:cellulose synthase operon protein YhjQ/BcsQ [Thermogutta sp.]HPZ82389.1 cellulose synthase operon protein YhjQ/BcsQ [Thermogutta sp.]